MVEKSPPRARYIKVQSKSPVVVPSSFLKDGGIGGADCTHLGRKKMCFLENHKALPKNPHLYLSLPVKEQRIPSLSYVTHFAIVKI